MCRQTENISFLWISSKLSTIAHMLLHNSYMHVAIAVLLLYWKSLYDLQKPKCKNPTFGPKGHNWAWSPGVCAAWTDQPPRFLGWFLHFSFQKFKQISIEFWPAINIIVDGSWVMFDFFKKWRFAVFRSSRELKVGYRNMYLCYSALAENLSGLFARAQMLYFNRDTWWNRNFYL